MIVLLPMISSPSGPFVSAACSVGVAVSLWPGGAGEAIPAPGLEFCAALLLCSWLPNMAVEMGWSWASGDLLLAIGAASGCGCGVAGTLPLP